MRRHPTMLLPLLLSLLGCASASSTAPEQAPAPAPPPAFVEALITGFKGEPVANPPASVWQYRYRGNDVFYVPPTCCDIPGQVYTASGAPLCQPDGGLTGRGDGQCPDFAAARSDERRIWVDDR